MAAAIGLSPQHSCSLDHLVGSNQQTRRHSKAECLGGLEVQCGFKSGWPLYRKIGRRGATQYAVHVIRRLTRCDDTVGTIGHETAGRDPETCLVDRR